MHKRRIIMHHLYSVAYTQANYDLVEPENTKDDVLSRHIFWYHYKKTEVGPYFFRFN